MYLFVEAFDGEFASLFVFSLSIDDVHSAKNQSPQPGKGQKHDSTASKSTAGKREVQCQYNSMLFNDDHSHTTGNR